MLVAGQLGERDPRSVFLHVPLARRKPLNAWAVGQTLEYRAAAVAGAEVLHDYKIDTEVKVPAYEVFKDIILIHRAGDKNNFADAHPAARFQPRLIALA